MSSTPNHSSASFETGKRHSGEVAQATSSRIFVVDGAAQTLFRALQPQLNIVPDPAPEPQSTAYQYAAEPPQSPPAQSANNIVEFPLQAAQTASEIATQAPETDITPTAYPEFTDAVNATPAAEAPTAMEPAPSIAPDQLDPEELRRRIAALHAEAGRAA